MTTHHARVGHGAWIGLLLTLLAGPGCSRNASTETPRSGGGVPGSPADSGTTSGPSGSSGPSSLDGDAQAAAGGPGGHSDNGPDAGSNAAFREAGSGSGASSCATDAGSTSSQPGYLGDWTSGDHPADFIDAGTYLTISGVTGQMGNVRQYAVHVPTSYDASAPVPAVFCLHGLGQTATMFCLDTGVAWPDKGDAEGFVVIMPNGYMNSWNGGTCCGAAAQDKLDDVSLIRAIFAEVGRHVNIDLRRVYATGLSNGAFLSYRLACEASDLFVAVAPGAGAVGTAQIGTGISELTTNLSTDLTSCAPQSKVSVLDIHGTSDPLIPYSDQAPSLAVFQASDGCSTMMAPASVVPSGGDTTCVSFDGCPACPNVNVTRCSIMGGGHCWFGSSDCGTGGGAIGTAIVGNNSNFMKNTDAIWNFFAPLSR